MLIALYGGHKVNPAPGTVGIGVGDPGEGAGDGTRVGTVAAMVGSTLGADVALNIATVPEQVLLR